MATVELTVTLADGTTTVCGEAVVDMRKKLFVVVEVVVDHPLRRA
jgi:hypothetical protein